MKRTAREITKRVIAALKSYVQNRNGGTFCLFLVFATVIWFGHALNSTRDQKLHIPIVYTGFSEEVMFAEELPQAFTIYVRDQGKRLRLYHNERFTPIQIDLRGQTAEESGKIQLTPEAVRQKITDQLQGTTRLQRVLPENIAINYYRQHQKTLPIRLVGEIELAPQYQFVTAPALTPTHITVYGAAETLEALNEVQTEPVQLSQVKDSINQQVALQPMAGIRFAQAEVLLQAVAEPFTEKVFTLPITAVGVPTGETLRLFPPTAEVTVRVGISQFNEVSAEDLQLTCNYPQTQVNHLPLNVHYTSPHITQVRVAPTEVEYIIEK